jgi:hypothetical protein
MYFERSMLPSRQRKDRAEGAELGHMQDGTEYLTGFEKIIVHTGPFDQSCSHP